VVTFGPGAIPLPNIDRWAANLGRSEGANAEEAVPFLGAVHRSFVLRFARNRWRFLWLFPPVLHDF
jgi:hypothetical protein